MQKPLNTICLFFVVMLISSRACAQDGILDPTFGNGGRVITDFGGFDVSLGLSIQADGKILVGGASSGTPQEAIVVRYLPDGSLDQSFGIGGKAGVVAGTAGSAAYALALQPDGKILITGETADTTDDEPTDIFLARFDPNGSLDATFGTNGITRLWDIGWNEEGLDIALQPNGKIVLTGHQDEQNTSFLVVFRFNSNGSLDESFGSHGRFVNPDAYSGNSISVAKDGSFIVIGQSVFTETTLVLAFNEAGALNPDFGNNGIAKLDLISENDKYERAFSSILNEDKSILLGGNFNGFGVARLLKNGTPDPAFGINGVSTAKLTDSPSIVEQGVTCMQQADGKIMVTGLLIDAGNDDFGIVRFKKNGALDTTFGNNGWVKTDMTGTSDWCFNSVIQPDKKLVLSGYSIGNQKIDILLARYNLQFDSIFPNVDTTAVELLPTRIYPSPTNGACTLEYSIAKSTTIMVDLLDSAGRWVGNLFFGQEDSSGNKIRPLDISGFADGYYVVKLDIGGEKHFLPILKIH